MATVTVRMTSGYLLSINSSVVFTTTMHLDGTDGDGFQLIVPGLVPKTLYRITVELADTQQPPNTAVPVSLSVATEADTVAPTFRGELPVIVAVTDASAMLAFAIDEPGLVSYVVRRRPSASAVASLDSFTVQHGAPDAPDVVARGSAVVTTSDVASARAMFHVLSNSLAPQQFYQVDVVARDSAMPSNTANVVAVPFTTTATSAMPGIVAGSPAIVGAADSWLQFNVTMDKPGAILFMALEQSSPAPTVAEVRSTWLFGAALASRVGLCLAGGGACPGLPASPGLWRCPCERTTPGGVGLCTRTTA